MRVYPLGILALAWITFTSLFALPQEAQVISGEAQMHSPQKDHLQITTSDKSIIHWEDFSIGGQELVQFIQPSSTSAVLNRVQGTSSSQILGQLFANGKVYLINPSGVIFGKDAIIRTADFLASTHDLSDSDFLLNHDSLFQGDSKEVIINYGTIQALEGNITLIGRLVDNQGILQASDGKVSLLAGQEILLKPDDNALLTIRPHLESSGEVIHSGQIEALIAELQTEKRQASSYGINVEGSVLALSRLEQNGKIYLKADSIAIAPEAQLNAPQGTISLEATSGSLYVEGELRSEQGLISIKNSAQDSPFHHLGTLDASGPQGGKIQIETTKLINQGNILSEGTAQDGGEITIHTKGPYIETTQGLLSTSGQQNGGVITIYSDTTLFSSGKHSSLGERGGEISFLSPTLTLVSANINTSGSSQGGKIFIGGGGRGETKGAPNSTTTYLSGDTHLLANAIESGDGGIVVVWSDEKTICYGSMQANAGLDHGDGGWIEISSHKDLYCGATLSANAPHGAHGTVLLDPKNIIINATTGVYPQYEFIDPNSGGGTDFGDTVVALSTGNVVITKPSDDVGGSTAGAVYLYDGNTAALISTLTGSTAGDQVGSGGAVALTGNGNYVVLSPDWNDGATTLVGAATWGDGGAGITGAVTTANSLFGSMGSDQVGFGGAIALTNGNYVVLSPRWDGGETFGVGAATWGDGGAGITGAVTTTNSLYGSTAGDLVGTTGAVALTNGNYVVLSDLWNNGGTLNAGAATWGDGGAGITGAVTTTNSLHGSSADDQVGELGAVALTNGNYVVLSPAWDDGATTGVGAATWGDGGTGITGAVTTTNSLYGSTTGDLVGENGAVALTNGNYVVLSPSWDNGATDVGAATWGDGGAGITGAVTTANSLHGSTLNDNVGNIGAVALTNGNYVVLSNVWDNTAGPTTNAGAATWGDGTTGITGAVTTTNSLYGGATNNRVGRDGALALTNGNYVVLSANWESGATNNIGAATWGDGGAGTTGTVTTANSLFGSTTNDRVGESGIALTNGNYVVLSPTWDDGATADVGAATWGDGTAGTTGVVSTTNSLYGSAASDAVGSGGAALTNGNYVVLSPSWDNGATAGVGAATWGDGEAGITGTITTTNSLVGAQTSSGLSTQAVDDGVNGTFLASFPSEGSGKVRVGLFEPSQMTFSRAQAQDMTITPSFLEATLDTGTAVVLQANNDITISDVITATSGAGALTLRAGRSALVNANITTGNGNLTIVANDLLANGVVDESRDAGDAVLSIANGVTIDAGTGNLSLSLLDGAGKTNADSGDLTIGDAASLQCSGSGVISITAEENNVVLGNAPTLQTVNGNLTLSAGLDISSASAVTIQTTGTGELVLICDNLFPTSPSLGDGKVTLSLATLTTAGGKLLIYTSKRALNTMPATINGTAFVEGTEFVDSTTEKWGIYFPDSSGVPFTVFYKEDGGEAPSSLVSVSSLVPASAAHSYIIAIAGVYRRWVNPWYTEGPFQSSIDLWNTNLFFGIDLEQEKADQLFRRKDRTQRSKWDRMKQDRKRKSYRYPRKK